MHVSSFPCPHCATTLRIRDRMYVGRQVDCPECRQPLQIVADGPKGFAAQPADAPEPTPPPTPPARRKRSDPPGAAEHKRCRPLAPPVDRSARGASRPQRGVRSRWAAVLLSPVGIGWTVAGGLGLGLILFLQSGPPDRPHVEALAANTVPPAKAPATDPKSDEPPDDVPGEIGGTEARLKWLGNQLAAYHARHGHFPSGTAQGPADGQPPSERLSWLARLVAESPEHGPLQPWWDQPWHAAANDRFVRRSLPQLLHPDADSTVGENRYPTTHFVGVAGVGSDGPTLPVGHPRAGLFGVDRPTRLKDIRDGAANTMAVAGVNGRLGSWAAGGPSTMRPFAREPYINGPDGFGAPGGQGLPVLMADGSVRTLAAETDPRLIRRMAAIADGLPLDATVPGEPGDAPADPPPSPDAEPPTVVAENGAAAAAPDQGADALRSPEEIIAELLQEPKPAPPAPIDVAGKLEQKILRFEQTRPAPARELLLSVEEMCGVPVRYDEQELAARGVDWQTPVAFSLDSPTVGDVLTAVLERIGAHYEIEPDGIRLRAGRARSRE